MSKNSMNVEHKKEAEIRRLYERYKLQWMLYHELNLVDLMDCMEAMIQEDLASGETRTKLQELFKIWTFDVGFPGGQIWPSYEEYQDCEYKLDSDAACMLISVFERNITTTVFPNWEKARAAMLEELKVAFLKNHSESEWDTLKSRQFYECDSFGFDLRRAWSALDSNCNWQIVSIPPTIA